MLGVELIALASGLLGDARWSVWRDPIFRNCREHKRNGLAQSLEQDDMISNAIGSAVDENSGAKLVGDSKNAQIPRE